ncbi:General secretion pathway protein D [Granulibacter bethesdensis CGDNIH4]|nr:General secretion pathway protein D [Granulibacter bethesdensis CGDNIH4]
MTPTGKHVFSRAFSFSAAVSLQSLCLCMPVFLASCGKDEPPQLEPLPPLTRDAGIAARQVNTTLAPSLPPRGQISYGRVPIQSGTASGSHMAEAGGNNITLNFTDTDIRDVSAQILGGLLKVNYTIDPSVHGTATFHTSQPLSATALLPTLQVLLNQNGAAVVQTEGLYRVLPIGAAAGITASAGQNGEAILNGGATIVPLRYASAEQLAKTLQPYAQNGAKIAADAGRNAVLVSGDPQAREVMIGLIQAFDVDMLAGQSFALFPADAGGAKEYAQALQTAASSQQGGALAGVVRILPMDRINAVLAVARSARQIEDLRRIDTMVGQRRRQSTRSWHVYYLQNGRSNDVAYVLQQAFTPGRVTAQPTPRNTTRPAGQSQSSATQGGAGGINGGVTGGTSSMPPGGNGGLPQAGNTGDGTQPQSGSSNPLLGPLTGAGGGSAGSMDDAGSDSNALRIVPNTQNNAVLIFATESEYGPIETMLRKIDILPLQVRIDAIIAEVTLNDTLRYGTQFFFREGGLNSAMQTAAATAATASTGGLLAAAIPGFSNGFLLTGSSSSQLAMTLLQSVTKVQVLSSPELMVLDNEPAKLQVGALVPYLTAQSQATIGQSAIINAVSYQQTGVILNVTPRVNNSGLVTLDISQEVSDVDTSINTNGISSPAFQQRSVQSRVVVQDGQTVGLAGLIRDNNSRANGGVPFLKDVPVLGSVFGQQNNNRSRTELLILVTPHVIHDQRDARALTEDLRQNLRDAALVPQELNHLRPTGSADPNRHVRHSLGLER